MANERVEYEVLDAEPEGEPEWVQEELPNLDDAEIVEYEVAGVTVEDVGEE